MYEEDPLLKKTSNERKLIWRYMDFPKFLYLLENSSLYFPKASKLGDLFEGAWTRLDWDTFKRMFPQIKAKLRKQGRKNKTLEEWASFVKVSDIAFKSFNHLVCINSWHISEYESAAMWKVYLKSNYGIAIQSTVKRLERSLQSDSHEIYVGLVRYIDYDTDLALEVPELFGHFLYKRQVFEYERELRAILLDVPINTDISEYLLTDGVSVAVDLETLIQKIYLAPTCPKWQFDLIKSIMNRYGINKEVFQSSLDNKPINILEAT